MAITEVESIESARQLLQGNTLPTVVVPVFNAYDDCLACFESILRHTPQDVPLVVVDDAGGDARSLDHLLHTGQTSSRQILIFRHQSNIGFVGSCNDAFEIAQPNDVILVNSDVIVGPEWYERLCEAANSSSLVATVSTLTNHGTILSVPNFNQPLPQLPAHLTPDSAAEAVAQYSLRIRPTISTAIGHCTYIRRIALDAVGKFDVTFGRGYGEEVDFSQRAIRLGFKHICADDVFTFHRGSGSFGNERTTSQLDNEKIVHARYPWYVHWNQVQQKDVYSPLSVALVRAAIGLRGLAVAIDGRALGPTLMGTQQVIIETVRTLAHHPLVSRVIVYVSGEVPAYARDRLSNSGAEFRVVTNSDQSDFELCDIAYRPYQTTSVADIRFLKSIGRWISINQLDNIAFSNPSYFANSREWFKYRDTARLTLASTDGVAYLSRSSMHEALSEGLVPAGTSQKVVYTGTQFESISEASMPRALKNASGPFLFVLGVSYLHKNRPFVVQAVAEMRRRGWRGTLVLAGPTPPSGSSLGLEAAEFLKDTELRKSVLQLPSISESEKRWLFENSSLMLYPTFVEGFGLVPFEAASYGLATLSTRQGSLNEVLPEDIPTISSFNPAELAEQILDLLENESQRQMIVDRIKKNSEQFSAESTSDQLVELFLDMTSRPPKRVAAIFGEDTSLLSSEGGRASLFPEETRSIEPGFIVKLGWRLRRVKRLVSPDGSRRQTVVRTVSNKTRQYLGR
jgi:GT2 family glycosyltransferase